MMGVNDSTWDRNWGCRLEIDSEIRGWAAAVLQNKFLRVTVLTGKGCDIVEMLYKPLDIDITPRTHRGLRRRELVMAGPWSEEGSFLDQYEGGWQEILPHGGPPGKFKGASFPQHGESARLPWEVRVIEDSPNCVEVLASVRLAIMPFLVTKRFRLTASSATLEMTSVVTNESAVDLPLMWGQHLVFGAPAFGPGATIELPDRTPYFAHRGDEFSSGRRSDGQPGMWPEMIDAQSRSTDMSVFPPINTPTDLHYLKPSEGWYAVVTKDKRLRVKVEWGVESQPYLWFWQQFGAWKEYPWWGTEYLVGLEPWTSAPGTGLGDPTALDSSPRIAAGESIESMSVITIEREKE
jgi:galactose mutarotase-like enzyme